LFQHRQQLCSLNTIRSLTRGKPLTIANILSNLFSNDDFFTLVIESDNTTEKIIGQLHKSPEMPSAYVNFLLLPSESNLRDLVSLLDGLSKKAGAWGAKQVVAEITVDSDLFSEFRQTGFSILAKQNVFRWDSKAFNPKSQESQWRFWNNEDISAMRSLYLSVVPPLIQTIESITRRKMLGLVHYDEQGNLGAFVDLVYGPVGVWVLPTIHPQITSNISDLIMTMLSDLPDLNGRPVYIIARSYQPWVEQGCANLSLETGTEQVLMVRYLALRQKVESEFSFSKIENSKTEPTAPLAPIKIYKADN
jgi:hypothetical protein